MSILGHDIDGRPLRVGDEVVVVATAVKSNYGKRTKVTGYLGEVYGWEGEDRVEIDVTLSGLLPNTFCNHHPAGKLRKLHNDHRPANDSFTEIMSKFKGVGV